MFIDVLRSLPPGDRTVSKDCLITVIQRESPHVHVRYEPYGIAEAQVASTTMTFTVPVASLRLAMVVFNSAAVM